MTSERRKFSERKQSVLNLINQQPGISTNQIAETLNITYSIVYRILPELKERGLIYSENRYIKSFIRNTKCWYSKNRQ